MTHGTIRSKESLAGFTNTLLNVATGAFPLKQSQTIMGRHGNHFMPFNLCRTSFPNQEKRQNRAFGVIAIQKQLFPDFTHFQAGIQNHIDSGKITGSNHLLTNTRYRTPTRWLNPEQTKMFSALVKNKKSGMDFLIH